MNKYLLDTNICIYYIKGRYNLKRKLEEVDPENCYISEITLAELMFGVENSENKEKNRIVLNDFLLGIKILPIFHAIDLYAIEKARLRRLGMLIDDFDLLIGVTAHFHNLIMVTNNTEHFKRMDGIELENWTNLYAD